MKKIISILFVLIIFTSFSFGKENSTKQNIKNSFGLELTQLNSITTESTLKIGYPIWSDDSTSNDGAYCYGYAQVLMDGAGNIEAYASTATDSDNGMPTADYIDVMIQIGGQYSFNSANYQCFVWTTLEIPYWNICSCVAQHNVTIYGNSYSCTTVVDGADNDL